MGCKEVSFSVNGREFKILEWAPTYALKLKAEIIRTTGSLLSSEKEFSYSLRELDPDKSVNLLKKLTQDVMSIENKRKIDFDEYFSDFPEDLYPIVIEVVKIQFLRFFGEKGSILFRQKIESISPKT